VLKKTNDIEDEESVVDQPKSKLENKQGEMERPLSIAGKGDHLLQTGARDCQVREKKGKNAREL